MHFQYLIGVFLLAWCEATENAWTKDDVITYKDVSTEEETVLTPIDFLNAEHTEDIDLTTLGIVVPLDPLTNSGKFEGDIAGVTSATLQSYIEASNDLRRVAIRDRWRRWPNGIVPYTLSSRYGAYARRTIAKAMAVYQKKTCVRFVPRERSKHRDYIYIHPDDGCYSLVGRTGGRQPLSLDMGCLQTGTVMHELMHSIGFFHEQSRNDRDDWINIEWDNVKSEAYDQFEKYSLRSITHLNIPYDYNSIMHYGPYAFSRNGRKTIRKLKSGGHRMGQRESFSDLDLKKIRKLYSCNDNERTSNEIESTSVFPETVDPFDPTDDCKDLNWRCAFWAMSVMGYCGQFDKVRNELCPKSCGACKTTESKTTTLKPPKSTTFQISSTSATPVTKQCDDRLSNCGRWAGKGFCNKNGYQSFMKKSCASSCGECSKSSASKGKKGGNAGVQTTTKENSVEEFCIDEPLYDSQCRIAELLGACRSGRNRRLMEQNCRRTCGFCD